LSQGSPRRACPAPAPNDITPEELDLWILDPDVALKIGGATQATLVLKVPGKSTVMTPRYWQAHLLVLLRAGLPAIVTVGDPGVHGAGMTGTHGCGVSTPLAAAVAVATAGFVGALHIPNDGMFVIGTWSMTVAAAMNSALVRFTGCTLRNVSAKPKLHFRIAQSLTSCAIATHPPERIVVLTC
jgi:hypothetical protein